MLEKWVIIAGQIRYFSGTHPVDEKEVDPPKDWAKQVEKDVHRRGPEDGQWQTREVWRRECERRPSEL